MYLDEEKETSQGWTHQKTGNGAKGKKSGSIWAWRCTTGCSHPHLILIPSDIKRNQKLFKILGERSNYSNIFKRLLYLRARCIVNRIDHIFVLHNVFFFSLFWYEHLHLLIYDKLSWIRVLTVGTCFNCLVIIGAFIDTY